MLVIPHTDPSKVSLLLVEDDELDVRATRRALRPIEDRIDFFSVWNGREALDLLRQSSSDLVWPVVVVLDLNMPEMDGFSFLDAVRGDAELSDLPVIIFTTSDREADVIDAYKRHVVGYVKKPLDPNSDRGIVDLLEAYLNTVILPKRDPRHLH